MSIPTISFATLRGDDSDARQAELRKLRDATHEIGFFYLGDIPIGSAEIANIFQLAEGFFALPAAVKRELDIENSPHYRGYTPLGDERTQGKVDWREQLDIGIEREPRVATESAPWEVLEGPNQWNSASAELQVATTAWISTVSTIGIELLRAWAEALGQEPDFFDELFQDPYSILKVIHYPAVPDTLEQALDQGVGAHKDPGVLTLLLPEPDSTGLQVQLAGEWVDVPVKPGTFVVNIGELLEWATDGYLIATPHRVLPTAAGDDRLSIPFFLYPNLGQDFPRLQLPAELQQRARGVGADLHGQEIFASTGLNVLKTRLRAHPNVTERHHAALASRVAAH